MIEIILYVIEHFKSVFLFWTFLLYLINKNVIIAVLLSISTFLFLGGYIVLHLMFRSYLHTPSQKMKNWGAKLPNFSFFYNSSKSYLYRQINQLLKK